MYELGVGWHSISGVRELVEVDSADGLFVLDKALDELVRLRDVIVELLFLG